MHCESLYNLDFESDLVTGFPFNSSGFPESWGIDHVAQPSPFDAELNNILLYPSLVAEQSKSKSVVERKEENVARKKTRVSETKTTAALKSHSEAERRRRERINAHLETLRGLVPIKEKIDKATLLAEVINHVKQLRATAEQSARGLNIPTDTDDVRVEILENNDTDSDNDNPFLLRACLCCEQSPELLPGLMKAIKDIDIPARVLKCEVSMLEGRMKIVFLITCGTKGEGNREVMANNVRALLCGVLDKVSEAAEYAQPMPFPRKRHRGSYLGAVS